MKFSPGVVPQWPSRRGLMCVGLQWFASSSGLSQEVDLADGEIIGGPPEAVEQSEVGVGKRGRDGVRGVLFHGIHLFETYSGSTLAACAGPVLDLDHPARRIASASSAITCSSSVGMTSAAILLSGVLMTVMLASFRPSSR